MKKRNRKLPPVDLSEETYQRFCDLVPWGVRKKVVRKLVEDLLDTIEGPNGEYVLGAILKGELRAEHIIKTEVE